MNTWQRLDGPTQISLSEANAGDDATGDYAWSSLYGCGLARVEITHCLVVADMMEEWSDENRAYILEGSHFYTVLPPEEDGDYGEIDEYGYEDYEYEHPGLYDYEWSERERAYTALDEMAQHNMSWALCGPGEKSFEVYERAPRLREWDAAMNFENPLDIPA